MGNHDSKKKSRDVMWEKFHWATILNIPREIKKTLSFLI